MPDPVHFTKWSKLLRPTAWVLVAKKRWLGNKQSQPEVVDLKIAQNFWLKEIQCSSFSREINEISRGNPVPRNSHILKLCPYLDAEGLLRASGRANRVKKLPKFNNDPIILDGSYYVTCLIIKHHHELFNHENTQAVLNELRQTFWITRVRTVLRSISAHCPTCQLHRARPQVPREGDLPEGRLAHGLNVFSHCSIDYFGPLMVSIGRRREKRWGVVFTCLTTRAVHLEIADSLTTDSAIMAIQRFTALRGQPSSFYSDNGMNLRGACEELCLEYEKINVEKLKEFGAMNGTKWEFMPPAAPHMGGVWESMVKSVKKSLSYILTSQAPREEVLRTLFAEAEHTVTRAR